jgi:hypothetical protein
MYGLDLRLNMESLDMKIRRIMLLLLIIAELTALQVLAKAQSPAASGSSSSSTDASTPVSIDLTYTRPTQTTKLRNYLFDGFGPYPIVGAAAAAGINQAFNTPPEWQQGAQGFGKRFGSDFGIAAVSTTTRYALAQAFRQDTLYYRCECKGVLPRLRHAVLSTMTARQGIDGNRVFSVPALVAPYAGTAAAVYGWYPERFGAKDAFRMGNYSLLAYVGGKIAREFLYGGPHSLFTRIHPNNGHGAPAPGSKP